MTAHTSTQRSGRFTAPWVVTMDGPPRRDAVVVVESGRVVGVEPRRADDVPVADVITPGLVNAHAHLEYGHPFADLADGTRPFSQWLPELPRRSRTLSQHDWLESARDGVRRMIATGTTCVADVVTFGPGLRAAAEAGLAGVSYVEVVAADERVWGERERDRLLRILAQAPAGRTVGISPHTLYTLGTSVFRECLVLARERGMRLHTHLAENAEECEFVMSGTGRFSELSRRAGLALELEGSGAGVSPTRHLDDLGGLGDDVHVAHGVHVDSDDRALLRARRSLVALCVRSNRTLGVGSPPVADYLAQGGLFAVGTDSLASSPDLDLLAELRAMRALALAHGAPEAGLDESLLRAGTRSGAVAMGLEDCGILRPGARADLALFRTGGEHRRGQDPYGALLANGRCVGVVLGGRRRG